MSENETLVLMKKISELVKKSPADPAGAVEKLLELKKEAEGTMDTESLEYYNAAASIYEAIGDVQRNAKKPVEAEKAYKEMMQFSSKLYQADKEKYDLRQGISHYKFASLYRAGIQCTMIMPKPRELNDVQKKVFGLTEQYYKNTIVCITDKAKKGNLRYVEMHSMVMNELAVMYACIGNYKKAIEVGLNGINVDKAIYDRHDDKIHGIRLATRMNTVAAIYSFMKDTVKAAETLEDANFVLDRHEEEEKVTVGLMLARNHLNLGNCYKIIEEEKENAEETLLFGLNKILAVNTLANDRMLEDVMMAYMVVGDYYRGVKNQKTAKENYCLALENAKALFEKTKNVKYKTIIERLEKMLNGGLN